MMIASATRAKATSTATSAGVPDGADLATAPPKILSRRRSIQWVFTAHRILHTVSLHGVEGSGALDGLVRNAHSHMLGVVNGLVQQAGHVMIEEGVDGTATGALASHQAQRSQEPELMGDGRLLHSHRLAQLCRSEEHTSQLQS